jgi:hypothetical protein
MVWKKINRYEWKNSSIKGSDEISHIIIDAIDGLFYVRKYNNKGILLDSLAESSHEEATAQVNGYIKRKEILRESKKLNWKEDIGF